MTEHSFGYRDDDVHALSGAYAVDALDEHERARFEQHLRACPECRTEVDSLREGAATLGIEDAMAPPPALREQVLTGIESVRPLPPLSPAVDEPAVDTLSARRARRRVGGFGTPLLVAASIILVLAAGFLLTMPWSTAPEAPPTATEQVLTADDASRVSQEFPDGSRATIVVSREVGRAVILTEDMEPAPPGKDYQLWLQDAEKGMAGAGLMPDERDATVLLDGDASQAIGVGITVEPAGGSESPTTKPIALLPLDA
ncbi:anti-sigma factor [Nocardioides panacisoli]|uniref:anti-sigma factor n=1 Tax=Nocardioides panacisoli TaxID=627624 RepID=UPI001C639B74|nr:anti-sigma factor [Nocardioides panacisoli]QYJ03174.1 anti-sigma factor [Nocardioides panacisoli]